MMCHFYAGFYNIPLMSRIHQVHHHISNWNIFTKYRIIFIIPSMTFKQIFHNLDPLLPSSQTFTCSTLQSPTMAITSISTQAFNGNFPAWKQVRAGKFVVKTFLYSSFTAAKSLISFKRTVALITFSTLEFAAAKMCWRFWRANFASGTAPPKMEYYLTFPLYIPLNDCGWLFKNTWNNF